MIASSFISFLAMASTAVLASPIGNETELVKRQIRDWNCGGKHYTQAQVQDAFNRGIQFKQTGQSALFGSTPYPHEFRNGLPTRPEVDPSPCAGLEFQEFPILPGGVLYSGGWPDADRVVFGSSNPASNSWTPCYLITHTGAASRRLFVKCT
ncbi:Ribonuclease/ribotoxin [Annulohypoxylon maeteangense]|uniref:Ribonuclease/ribotoxin n=1 Tax=Annulohypoxylon maeteangense TaxID=1927788 RepID=UPI0020074854|nr:Ribonuclease/ribotoxin [Annulohypoxylon maeteangense]KAI0882270.1 Ribonuclease/ribotoxin [Annulohypoxylon maeteangense]